jgi:hypothetical protein
MQYCDASSDDSVSSVENSSESVSSVGLSVEIDSQADDHQTDQTLPPSIFNRNRDQGHKKQKLQSDDDEISEAPSVSNSSQSFGEEMVDMTSSNLLCQPVASTKKAKRKRGKRDKPRIEGLLASKTVIHGHWVGKNENPQKDSCDCLRKHCGEEDGWLAARIDDERKFMISRVTQFVGDNKHLDFIVDMLFGMFDLMKYLFVVN